MVDLEVPLTNRLGCGDPVTFHRRRLNRGLPGF